MQAPK